jgi:hypothetical protein
MEEMPTLGKEARDSTVYGVNALCEILALFPKEGSILAKVIS